MKIDLQSLPLGVRSLVGVPLWVVGELSSPRMAIYRRWRYAQSANFAKAKAASARMSGFEIKVQFQKKKRPSNDGLRNRGMLLGEKFVKNVPLNYKLKPTSPRDADTRRARMRTSPSAEVRAYSATKRKQTIV